MVDSRLRLSIGVVLVLIQFVALWLGPFRRSVRGGLLLFGAAVIAAIPSLLYFGYSQIVLGTISVSSRCRSWALSASVAACT